MIDLSRVTGFDWDEGNARKNERHGVSMAEAEQVFFIAPVVVVVDPQHSQVESRFHSLGRTAEGRRLHVTFTLRGDYAYPSTGEVIDPKTKKIVTHLKDEQGHDVQSEKLLEIDWAGGEPVRNGDQFGVGRAAR